MSILTEEDALRLKALLDKTGEFIAYFEMVDSKLLSWRQDIETIIDSEKTPYLDTIDTLNLIVTKIDAISEKLCAEPSQALVALSTELEAIHKACNKTISLLQPKRHTNTPKTQSTPRLFQHNTWQAAGIAVISSLISAFVMSFYLNNQFPWEIHQKAFHERQAGRILIAAWPHLSSEEQQKISSTQVN